MIQEVSLAQILNRIDISQSLKELIKDVVREYAVGKVISWEPMRVGYSDVNVKVITSTGIYLLKIFNKDKSYQNIADYIKGLVEFRKVGVPTPRLLKNKNKFLYKLPGNKIYLCLMEFFDGKNFNDVKITKKDLAVITTYITKIHKLRFSIHKNYDSWGTVNLLKEYRLKGKYLTKEDRKLLDPVINDFKKINFSQLPKSIIHGDLHKDHVLKNRRGEYCLIDLDVMDFNARVVDLAIFLALIAYELDSAQKDRETYKFILKEYQHHIQLNRYELQVLPTLIRATYLVYLIRSNFELIVNRDRSKQTSDWFYLARKGLIISLNSSARGK